MRSRNNKTRTKRTSRRTNRKRTNNRIRKRTNKRIRRTNNRIRKRTNKRIRRTNNRIRNRKINRLIGGKNKTIDGRYPDLYYFRPENVSMSDDDIDSYNKVNIYFKGGKDHGLNNDMYNHYRNSRSESQRFVWEVRNVENTGTIIADDSETNSIKIRYTNGVYEHYKYVMDVELSDINKPVDGIKFPNSGFYIKLTEESKKKREAFLNPPLPPPPELEPEPKPEPQPELEPEPQPGPNQIDATAQLQKELEEIKRKAQLQAQINRLKQEEEEAKVKAEATAARIAEEKTKNEAGENKTPESEYIQKLKELLIMVDNDPGKILDFVIEKAEQDVKTSISKNTEIECKKFNGESKWVEIIENDGSHEYAPSADLKEIDEKFKFFNPKGFSIHYSNKNNPRYNENVCRELGVSAWIFKRGNSIDHDKSIGLELADLMKDKENFNYFKTDLENFKEDLQGFEERIEKLTEMYDERKYAKYLFSSNDIKEYINSGSEVDDNIILMDYIVNLIVDRSQKTEDHFNKTFKHFSGIERADMLMEILRDYFPKKEEIIPKEEDLQMGKYVELYKTLYFNKTLAEYFTDIVKSDILPELEKMIKIYKIEEVKISYKDQKYTLQALKNRRDALERDLGGFDIRDKFQEWKDKVIEEHKLAVEIYNLKKSLQLFGEGQEDKVLPFDEANELDELQSKMEKITSEIKQIEEEYPGIIDFNREWLAITDLINNFNKHKNPFHHEYITQLKDNLQARFDQMISQLKNIFDFVDKHLLKESGIKIPFNKGVFTLEKMDTFEGMINVDKMKELRQNFDYVKNSFDIIKETDIGLLKTNIDNFIKNINNVKGYVEPLIVKLQDNEGPDIFYTSYIRDMVDDLFKQINSSGIYYTLKKIENQYENYEKNRARDERAKHITTCNLLEQKIDAFYEKRKKQALERVDELKEIQEIYKGNYQLGVTCKKPSVYLKEKKKKDDKLNIQTSEVKLSRTLSNLSDKENISESDINRYVERKKKERDEKREAKEYDEEVAAEEAARVFAEEEKSKKRPIAPSSGSDKFSHLAMKPPNNSELDKINLSNPTISFEDNVGDTLDFIGGSSHRRKIKTIQKIRRKLNRN